MRDRPPRPLPEFKPIRWPEASPSCILARISEAEIVGMGGAGYPTAAKLASGLRYGTRHVVANGVECEPGVNADRSLLQNYLQDVVEGIRIVGRCLACESLTIAVADPTTRQALAELGSDEVNEVIVAPQPANGEERTLISLLFGDKIPSNVYPTQRGFVVLNVATLFAICEAVRDGYRPTDRILTVLGKEQWVTLNTPIDMLANKNSALRYGSTATGRIATISDTVKLTTNAIAPDQSEYAKACIHCAQCDDVCPRKLPVDAMLRAVQNHERYPALENQFDACFECGACVAECPSEIPLLDWLRQGKRKAADASFKLMSEERFERHQAREEKHRQLEAEARKARYRISRKW